MEISEAFEKAYIDTALFMTSDIRQEALKSGWGKDVVSKIRVTYKNGKFAVDFPESVADRAWVYEYGDPDNTPTAVIRKYDNNAPKMYEFLEERLNHHLEKAF